MRFRLRLWRWIRWVLHWPRRVFRRCFDCWQLRLPDFLMPLLYWCGMMVLRCGYFHRRHGLLLHCNRRWQSWLPGPSIIRVPRRSGFWIWPYFYLSGLWFNSLISLVNTPAFFNNVICFEIIITSVMYYFLDHAKIWPSSNLLVSMSMGSLVVYTVIMVTWFFSNLMPSTLPYGL